MQCQSQTLVPEGIAKYARIGRGAFVTVYNSEAQMHLGSTLDVMYVPMFVATQLKNESVIDACQRYDPATEVVIFVHVHVDGYSGPDSLDSLSRCRVITQDDNLAKKTNNSAGTVVTGTPEVNDVPREIFHQMMDSHHSCVICQTECSQTCHRCKTVAYCSKACQGKDRLAHLTVCADLKTVRKNAIKKFGFRDAKMAQDIIGGSTTTTANQSKSTRRRRRQRKQVKKQT